MFVKGWIGRSLYIQLPCGRSDPPTPSRVIHAIDSVLMPPTWLRLGTLFAAIEGPTGERLPDSGDGE